MVSLSLVRNKTSSPKFYLFSDALVLVQVSNSVSGCQRGGRGKWGGCWRSPGDQGWEGGSGEDAGGHRETRAGWEVHCDAGVKFIHKYSSFVP